jgi:hypothetical protein
VCECDEPRFMTETRTDVFRSMRIEAVRLTHLPTGIVMEAKTREEAGPERLSDEHPCQFGPLSPIAPVPVELSDGWPEPRRWKYRVC